MNNLFKKLALTDPGDAFLAYVTQSNRQVIKLSKNGVKHSAVKYPNGRIVETLSYFPESRTRKNLLEKLFE